MNPYLEYALKKLAEKKVEDKSAGFKTEGYEEVQRKRMSVLPPKSPDSSGSCSAYPLDDLGKQAEDMDYGKCKKCGKTMDCKGNCCEKCKKGEMPPMKKEAAIRSRAIELLKQAMGAPGEQPPMPPPPGVGAPGAGAPPMPPAPPPGAPPMAPPPMPPAPGAGAPGAPMGPEGLPPELMEKLQAHAQEHAMLEQMDAGAGGPGPEGGAPPPANEPPAGPPPDSGMAAPPAEEEAEKKAAAIRILRDYLNELQ